MEIAIKDHCDNSSNNGLFLLDMPTGYGKTYSDMKGPYVKAQKALFSLFLVFFSMPCTNLGMDSSAIQPF